MVIYVTICAVLYPYLCIIITTKTLSAMKKIFLTIALSAMLMPSLMAQTKVDYRHFSPSTSQQINSRESVDITLVELKEVANSGAAATQKEVAFQIEYLEKVKSLLAKCKDSDAFTSQLITAYPTLDGAESVKAIAKSLYPNEMADPVKEQVRARVGDYFNMVSNLDADIAKGLWAESDNVSIITPRSQFVGRDAIMNDFLIKTFSSMKSRKLHSLSEVINVYGDSANVQLYWIFDTIDAKGEAHQTRGRESLVFSKIDGEWRLVHVHYSRMPQ